MEAESEAFSTSFTALEDAWRLAEAPSWAAILSELTREVPARPCEPMVLLLLSSVVCLLVFLLGWTPKKVSSWNGLGWNFFLPRDLVTGRVLVEGVVKPRWASDIASAAADKAVIFPLSREEDDRVFVLDAPDAVLPVREELLTPEDEDPLNTSVKTDPRLKDDDSLTPSVAVDPLTLVTVSWRDPPDVTADPPRPDELKDPLVPKADGEDPWFSGNWEDSLVFEVKETPEKPGRE